MGAGGGSAPRRGVARARPRLVCAVLGRPSLWGGRCSGDLAAAGDGGCCHDGRVTELDHPHGPPYVRCRPPIAVEVQHGDGGWYGGEALAYCGERVTVRYSVEAGAQHQLVVDASEVRRT